jgi:glutamate synthase domain-containing protein 3
LVAEENVIIGNVAFYGAIKGDAFINGKAGERFCVRNSGANVVVEGVGRHGCEYMTGGTVVILGDVGTNFGAGMSGGVAFIYDPKKQFEKYKNTDLHDYYPVDFEDEEILRELITKHQEKTGSKLALTILEDWDKALTNFIKVLPKEYSQALKALKATKEVNVH